MLRLPYLFAYVVEEMTHFEPTSNFAWRCH